MGDVASAGTRQIEYRDKPGLAWLAITTFLLTIVTVGFYRFWARVRLRRYFWGRIAILGEPIEYTGTGRELFIGFLIAIAILAPMFIAYAVLQRVTLGDPTAQLILTFCYLAVLGGLVQMVVFRARRYRLSRTSWRGIRAGQGGSTWRYLAISVRCLLLGVLTVGLYAPWADMALERYKTGNSWFGSSRLSLEASAWPLFPKWLVVEALFLLPIAAALLPNLDMYAQFPVPPGHPIKAPHPGAFGFLAISVLAGFPALIWYRVASFRYMASATRLGEIRLRSAASGGAVMLRVLAFVAGSFGLFVLFAIVVGGGMFAMVKLNPQIFVAAGKGQFHPPVLAVATLIVAYLMLICFSQAIFYCWLRAPVIRHLVNTLDAENLDTIAAVSQSTAPRQRFGEGFADSFEIGSF
jgi:uncharacterized membrane protein YjgN (DUF898 family)